LLDNIIINFNHPCGSISGILLEDFSDHMPVFLSLKMKNNVNMDTQQHVLFKTVTEDSIPAFESYIANVVDAHPFQTLSDVDVDLESLIKLIEEAYHKFYPTKRQKAKKTT
jgi:hypothetical protein